MSTETIGFIRNGGEKGRGRGYQWRWGKEREITDIPIRYTVTTRMIPALDGVTTEKYYLPCVTVNCALIVVTVVP